MTEKIYPSYLEINVKDLADVLVHQNYPVLDAPGKNPYDTKLHFTTSISLSYSPFEGSAAGEIKSQFTISQILEGTVSDTTSKEYSIPMNLKPLSLNVQSQVMLPYSYMNILNGDLTLETSKITRKCVTKDVKDQMVAQGEWKGEAIENVC